MLAALSIYPIVLAVALIVGRRACARRLSTGQVAMRVLFVLYLGWIIGATLLPLPPTRAYGEDGFVAALNHPNLMPFANIRETLALPQTWPRVRLLVGNVVVLVPFGLLPPLIWPQLARWSRIALAGLLFSLAIELCQLGVSLLAGYWYRMSDIDDVLLNVTGVLLGFLAYRALTAGKVSRPRNRPPSPAA